ncbi:phage head morphogenesis protein [Sulfitobacter sp.]|uniref:phage head morphogenesis protein n=1 Tax=Sulfitobacter sp. TaxID=1903071 RepID=UPI0030037AA2
MGEQADRPGYSFAPGPPPEASKFLQNKGWKPAFSWLDVEPEEHAVAFSVAKATSMDVLRDIREEVQAALDEGLPFEAFKERLQPKLEKRGWWGKVEAKHPTDPDKVKNVTLGTPRRLRTIYDANLRSARAAGQWDRIQRTKTAMPYLQYRLGPSENHRPHHANKEFLVLPVDDPFWETWYPPNGWGCKCWIKQITKRMAQELGISERPEQRTREWENSRTGEVKQIPVGIDPGWERNPGALRLRAMERLLNGKLDALPEEAARVVARDVATSWRAGKVMQGRASGAVPVAVLPDEIVALIGAQTRVVQMTSSYGDKFDAKGRDVSADQLLVLADALQNGKIARELVDGVESVIIFGQSEKPWRFVLKVLPDQNEIWLRTVHRTEARKWKSTIRRATTTVLRE